MIITLEIATPSQKIYYSGGQIYWARSKPNQFLGVNILPAHPLRMNFGKTTNKP